MKKKILFASDVQGDFEFLYTKIGSLIEKGNTFDFLICNGNFLSENTEYSNKYLSKEKKIPICTYFIDNGPLSSILSYKFKDGGEIVPNLHYLGDSGIKDIGGLNIGFLSKSENRNLSGFYKDSNANEIPSKSFEKNDLEKLIERSLEFIGEKKFGLDILLCNEWPMNFDKFSDFNKTTIPKTSEKIKNLINISNPRYAIFPGGKWFYQRNPYLNELNYSTRIIGVAPLPRLSKINGEKYLYAIEIECFNSLQQFPNIENSTENPFSSVNSKSLPTSNIDSIIPKAPIYNVSSVNDELISKIKQNELRKLYVNGFPNHVKEEDLLDFLSNFGKVKNLEIHTTEQNFNKYIVEFESVEETVKVALNSGKHSFLGRLISFKVPYENKQQSNSTCWFCLSSPQVDVSLIISVGKKYYFALEKGSITDYNFQIIPIQHLSGTKNIGIKDFHEISEIKRELSLEFRNSHSKNVIFYEKFIRLPNDLSHFFILAIPLSDDEIKTLIDHLDTEVESNRYKFEEFPDEISTHQFLSKSDYYFYINFFQGEGLKEEFNFVWSISSKEMKGLKQDIGRIAICEALNLKSKVNWRDCQVNEFQKEQGIKFLKPLCSSILI